MFIRLALVFSLFASMVLSGKDNAVYLAVGDSIAFGFSPLLTSYPPTNFKGYPEFIAEASTVHFAPELNISCPGETSASFVEPKPKKAPDNGCRGYKGYADGALLHVPYTSTQLDKTVEVLQTEKKISLVTINIGGNDLLLLQEACLAHPATYLATYVDCVTDGLRETLLPAYARNLSTILGAIRGKGDRKYEGTIVLLTQYSTDYRSSQEAYLQQTAVSALNSVARLVALDFGVRVADGYGAFAVASGSRGNPCAAGLLILTPLLASPCDVHPSAAGQKLLADTVLGVIGQGN